MMGCRHFLTHPLKLPRLPAKLLLLPPVVLVATLELCSHLPEALLSSQRAACVQPCGRCCLRLCLTPAAAAAAGLEVSC